MGEIEMMSKFICIGIIKMEFKPFDLGSVMSEHFSSF